MKPAALSVAVVIVWVAAEAPLCARADLDDHNRYTAAQCSIAARNYVRYGVAVEGGVPLANQSGPLGLARTGRYVSQPPRSYLELAVWFRLLGEKIAVARAWSVAWCAVALVALGVGAARGRSTAPALLPLLVATAPGFAHYAHAVSPTGVGVAAILVAAAARLARLEGAGRGALALFVGATALATATAYGSVFFAVVWAISDRRERKDGLVALAAVAVVVVGVIGWFTLAAGPDAWISRLAVRTGDAGPSGLARVARYLARDVGPVLPALAVAWALGLRRRARTPADRVALELLLGPLPWFLVFRELVAKHDYEVLWFVPGLALGAWSATRGLSSRRLAAIGALSIGAGVVLGARLEERDEWSEPRAIGQALRATTSFEEPAATSSIELSIVWEADRFVEMGVTDEAALEALLARPKAPPVAFALPRREGDGDLGRALARRFPSKELGDVLVFDLRH